MFCKYCGNEVSEDSIFCDKCGKRIGKIEESTYALEENTISNITEEKHTKVAERRKIVLLLFLVIIVAIIVTLCMVNIKTKQVIENYGDKNEEEIINNELVEHEHSLVYRPITDNTHIVTCKVEGCEYSKQDECLYVNKKCICGNEDIVNMPKETEQQYEETAQTNELELEKKLAGVWIRNERYFMYFDGNGGYSSGKFESDVIQEYTHIINVEEKEANIYDVEFEIEDFLDEDGYPVEGIKWTGEINGTYDGFKSMFSYDDEFGIAYFVYMGETMEEALEVYNNSRGFVDEYNSVLNKYVEGYKEAHELELENVDFVGDWYSSGYDPINDWATSFVISIGEEGTISYEGGREIGSGTYEIIGSTEIVATFTDMIFDTPGEGWVKSNTPSFTVDMIFEGKSAFITVNSLDTNLCSSRYTRSE